jgi:hypothetical protein
MPSYLKNQAVVYGCLVELDVDPMATRACTLSCKITFTAKKPQMGITLKMKAGANLRQQLAVQADRFLETIDESFFL